MNNKVVFCQEQYDVFWIIEEGIALYMLPWILFCKEQRHGGILLMYFWIMEERVVLYMLP